LTILLRPGNAGSNTAAEHITVIRDDDADFRRVELEFLTD